MRDFLREAIREDKERRAHQRALGRWAEKQLIQTRGIREFWDRCAAYDTMVKQKKIFESVGLQIRLRRTRYESFVQQCVLMPQLHTEISKFLVKEIVSKAQRVLEVPSPSLGRRAPEPISLATLGKFFPVLSQYLPSLCQLPSVVMVQGEADVAEQSAVLDSVAMGHSVNGLTTELSNRRPMSQPTYVMGVTGATKPIRECGDWKLPLPECDWKAEMLLRNTMNIEGSKHNLISVGLLDEAGFVTTFSDGMGVVSTKDGKVLMKCPRVDRLYRLPIGNMRCLESMPQHVVNWDQGSLLSAHEVLRHMNMDSVRRLLNFPPASATSPNPICTSCCYAKMRNKREATEALTAAPRFGYRLHSDTSRKMPATNAFGVQGIQRYILTGDEYTGFLWVEFGQRKSDATRLVLSRVNKINNKHAPGKQGSGASDRWWDRVPKQGPR